MITPKEAEDLAQSTIENYVNTCGCATTGDVANALMKLASMCGLGMCAVVGQPDAVARMEGTTNYIRKAQEGKNWIMQPLRAH